MVERIRILLESRQLSPTQFADAIGVARPIISHILSGRNKPSLEVVQRILAAMPDLAMPWLLNGTGEMLVASSGAQVATVPDLAPATPSIGAASPAINALPKPVRPVQPPATPVAPVLPSQQTADFEDKVTAPSEVAASRTTAPTAQQGSYPQSNANAAGDTNARMARAAAMPKRFSAATLKSKPALPNLDANQADIRPLPLAPRVVPAAIEEPIAAPEPLVEAPTMPAPAPVVSSQAAQASAEDDSSSSLASALFAGAEKPIRRIVIFYRDGSFADYQPE